MCKIVFQQDRQYAYKLNIEVRSRRLCFRAKDISTTCLSVNLVIQHAKRMWPVWLYHIFPHYLINDTIFMKPLPNIKCLF
jgi:hypothetical protein